MNICLNEVETRVIGCLIEKELTTPDYYPLTLNSLVAACNQKSNRSPAMELHENDIVDALEQLRYEYQWVSQAMMSGSRAVRYAHAIQNHYSFSQGEMAILCELMVRGPQTPGELRTHAKRMFAYDSVPAVEEALHGLMNWEGEAFVVKLARAPGRRDACYAHLFAGEIDPEELAAAATMTAPRIVSTSAEDHQRIETLESRVDHLDAELTELKQTVAAFRAQFE
jgi:uncharacterized protein YceH (UPF0502 family)